MSKKQPHKRLTAPKPATTVGAQLTREASMSTTATTASSTEKPKNGAKAPPAPAKPDSLDTADSSESAETVKRRGIVPTMPAAILYRLGGRVFAAIHHPIDGTSYTESGKGEGSAMGALVDSGFRLSGLTLDGPEWLSDKLPAGATLLGYASIKGFPLPVQPT